MSGKIQVTVQTEKRLGAITELAQAINKLAGALGTGTHIMITDCQFNGRDTGVNVDTEEKVTETTIMEIDDDWQGMRMVR